jgi:hypothetical protein
MQNKQRNIYNLGDEQEQKRRDTERGKERPTMGAARFLLSMLLLKK